MQGSREKVAVVPKWMSVKFQALGFRKRFRIGEDFRLEQGVVCGIRLVIEFGTL